MHNPSDAQYQTALQQVKPPGPTTHPGSTFLPLTGLDVGALALCAIALIAAGLVLRRMTP